MKITYTAAGADISGTYRFSLWREWAGGAGTCCFVMLNPSTADGTLDDPTVRRCVRYARDWGYSRLEVRNLYPLRATDPAELLSHPDPRGGLPGGVHLLKALWADLVVCGWGAFAFPDRLYAQHACLVREFAGFAAREGVSLKCLGLTKDGHPKHPLYLKADARPLDFPLTPAFAEAS